MQRFDKGVSRDKGLKCVRGAARDRYALSASVNSAVAGEGVLIVNLRFMEEADVVRGEGRAQRAA